MAQKCRTSSRIHRRRVFYRAVLVFAANERGQMLPGYRTPGLILFDEILLGETLAYVETILTSEPSLFVARHQLTLPDERRCRRVANLCGTWISGPARTKLG